jgi:hypothetical protein
MVKTRNGEVVGSNASKVGWRISEFAHDTGLSRAYVYNLLAAGALQSAKVGTARVITTSPAEFLARHQVATA